MFRLAIFAVVFLFLQLTALTACHAWQPTETKVVELAPGVYFRKCQTEPTFLGCNQGWVIFKDFVLVIDANFPNQADEVIRLIKEQTDKPIRYIFDTHYHGDHADGNARYAAIGATAVASQRSLYEFQTKGLTAFEGQQVAKPDEYGKLEYKQPALLFPQSLVFDDGEQRLELLYNGHAHTVGDAVAWLPKHGILFTGDSVVNGAFNYTGDSDTASWISVLNALEELPIKRIAPGHGEVADKSLIALQRRYFVELRSAIQAAITDGAKLAEIKTSIDLPFYEKWTGVKVSERVENIEHVYRELTKSEE